MLLVYFIIPRAISFVLRDQLEIGGRTVVPVVEETVDQLNDLEVLLRDSRSMEAQIFALRDKEMVDYSKRTIENITKYIQSLKEEKRSTISSPHHRVNHRRDRRIHRQRIKRGRKMSPKPSSTVPIVKSRTQIGDQTNN